MGAPRQAAKRTPNERVRAQKCLERRIAGESWQTIADAEEYADRSGPAKAVERLLSRVEVESVTEHRALELSRLDAIQAGHWTAAVSGDTKSADVVLKVIDRRIRLLGLAMPEKVIVARHEISDIDFAREAAQLIAEIGYARASAEDETDAEDDEPWSNIGQ